jgi:DNA polymerase III psi subunit
MVTSLREQRSRLVCGFCRQLNVFHNQPKVRVAVRILDVNQQAMLCLSMYTTEKVHKLYEEGLENASWRVSPCIGPGHRDALSRSNEVLHHSSHLSDVDAHKVVVHKSEGRSAAAAGLLMCG